MEFRGNCSYIFVSRKYAHLRNNSQTTVKYFFLSKLTAVINLKETCQLICNTNHLIAFFIVGAYNSFLLLFLQLLKTPYNTKQSSCHTQKYSEDLWILLIHLKKTFNRYLKIILEKDTFIDTRNWSSHLVLQCVSLACSK